MIYCLSVRRVRMIYVLRLVAKMVPFLMRLFAKLLNAIFSKFTKATVFCLLARVQKNQETSFVSFKQITLLFFSRQIIQRSYNIAFFTTVYHALFYVLSKFILDCSFGFVVFHFSVGPCTRTSTNYMS